MTLPAVGARCGMLEVIAVSGPRGPRSQRVLTVRCDCGVTKEICRTGWGTSRSCGCVQYRRGGHGSSGSPEYRAWLSMRSRCENPADAAYSNYGGRGIKVCRRWRSYTNFIADVGLKPHVTYRLDRREVNSNYTPKNCSWVSVQESNLNRRNAVRVRWQGELHYLLDVAALYGIPYRTAYSRIASGMLFTGERV